MSAALAEMLTSELALSDDLAVVPREAITRLRRELGIGGESELAADALERLQRALGVDRVVSGSYLATDSDRVRLDVRVWDDSAPAGFQALVETGSGDRLLDVVSSTGQRLRSMLGAGEPATGTPAAGDRSQELAATRHYVEGLELLRRQDASGARRLFEQSIAERPEQPLALLALSEAWALLGYEARAVAAAARASALDADAPRE